MDILYTLLTNKNKGFSTLSMAIIQISISSKLFLVNKIFPFMAGIIKL